MDIKSEMEVKLEELDIEYDSYQQGSQVFPCNEGNFVLGKDIKNEKLDEVTSIKLRESVLGEELINNDVKKSENLSGIKKNTCDQHFKKFTTLRNVSLLLKKVNDKCSDAEFESDEERFFAQLVKSKSPSVILNKLSHKELKILVTGHSWVQDMEDGFAPELMPGMEVVFRAFPGINLSGLHEKMVQILDATFTHMMVHIIITEAYRKVTISESLEDQNYWVMVANLAFNNNQFCRDFAKFSRHCADICPNIKIVLIIPPFLDLVYYNSLRVDRFPQRIKDTYNRRPEFSWRELHRQCVAHHSYIRTLRTNRYQWINKNTYSVMHVASALFGQRQKVRDFSKGKRLTLWDEGFLRDGMHPVAELCSNLWRRLYDARLFHLGAEVERVISSEVPTAPYMVLEVPEKQREEIGERREMIEEIREEVEPQAGPSGINRQEPIDVIEIDEERLAEHEEMESVVIEEDGMEKGERTPEVEEVVQVEEAPVQAREIRELRFEEDSPRASRRQNYLPIRFELSPEPEEGIGPIRDARRAGWRMTRGNPANKCSRERATPYERSHSAGRDQVRQIESENVRPVGDELEQQWRLKFSEFLGYMQGFMAAKGHELSSREVKEKVRKMCEER